MSEPVLSPPVTFPEDLNLADHFLFDRIKEGLGDKVAIRWGDRSFTYADVADRAHRLASLLARQGIEPGERVYIVLPDTPPFAWSFFGVLKAMCVVTMGNPDAPTSDLRRVIEYVRPRALITIPRVWDALRGSLRHRDPVSDVCLVPEVETGADPEFPIDINPTLDGMSPLVHALAKSIALGKSPVSPARGPHRDDQAIWLFTSGSTGRPKAAMHTHRDFAWNTELYARRTVGYRESDVTVSVPRLYFGYATGTNLMFPFAVGATVGLFAERPTPESLARAIERYRPTIVTNVPTMMGKLLDHDAERVSAGAPPFDFSSVRFHLSAGEALPEPLLARFTARFGCDVYDGIGSAEMFHIYVSNRPGDVRPGSLGRVVEGYEIRILPDDAEGPGAAPLPPGETGVLWVKGDSVALGYFRDRDKSWSTFHGHWCKTGDLFRLDADGYLYFAGRADDLLKVSGLWVAPTEVEACIAGHPAVAHCAVIGAMDEGLLKPKAFVVVRAEHRDRVATEVNQRDLADEIRELVKARLSKHKYPRWIVFVDDLPRNDRGKVDKKALRERETSAGAAEG